MSDAREATPLAALSARERILAEALELFAERGIEGVGLRELARRVDLHNSTLFHYFPNKRALARSVLDAVAQRQLESFEPLAGDDPPRLETLTAVLARAADQLRATPAEARLLLRAVAAEPAFADLGRGDASPPLRALLARIDDWVRRAVKAGAIRPAPVASTRDGLLALLLVPAARATPPDAAGDPLPALVARALAPGDA